jgi:hypothetical protein
VAGKSLGLDVRIRGAIDLA